MEGKEDAMAAEVNVARAARRVCSLFIWRAVDALLVGAGAKALVLARRVRVMAVENFMVDVV